MLAAIGFRASNLDGLRQCGSWGLAMRCDAVADISWRRVEGPHFDLYDGSLLTMIGNRANPPAEAEITVEPRPCWGRTSWDSPGLWGLV